MKTIKLSNSVPKTFKADDNKVVNSDGSRINETVINLFDQSKNNKSRNLTYVPNIEAIKKLTFLNPNAKKTFKHLQLAFIKPPIF